MPESNSRPNSTVAFQVSTWPDPSPEAPFPIEIADAVRIIGVGESAHFVAEMNHVRADVICKLRNSVAVGYLALEIGSDEAPAIQAWLDRSDSSPLREVVGPLTYCLYGSFLTELRDALEPDHGLVVLGVDLPNSLTIEPNLGPLASLLAHLDPDSIEQVDRIQALATQIQGGSAAASAFSWMEMKPTDQDTLTVSLSRLRGRIDALGVKVSKTEGEAEWVQARRYADAAVTTDLMLRAMADLFSGVGLPADTTLRERFISERLFEAVNKLADGHVIVYIAHNNHVQKSPVVFDDVIAAYPVGQFLAQRLGQQYWCLALTHLDSEVPEMVVPAPTDVGFRVERTSSSPISGGSVEAAAAGLSGETWLLRSDTTLEDGNQVTTIRSQSATTEISATSFDAVVVTQTASTDPAVERLA